MVQCKMKMLCLEIVDMKSILKRTDLVSGCLALCLVLAGCGSADSTPESTADALQGSIVISESVEESQEAIAAPDASEPIVEAPVSEEVIVEEPEPEQPTVSLVMVGDILLHEPVEKSSLQEDGSYNYDAIFANMKEDFQAADLALVNQEVIIGGEDLRISGYPSFNAAFSLGDSLVDAGFDVICHGTNHALDKGKKGLVNCLNYWDETYPEITVLGINESQEEQDDIYIYEQEGIRIAILNYTYGTNGIALPSDMPYAVDLLDKEKVVADLQKAEELADFTIVCPHWGTEYNLGIDSQQKKWADIFLKNGADLILGTHPHVIEPIEWLTDEETGNEMLVYYSLGNFVNWTSSSRAGVANRMVGGMAEVTIGLDENGEVVITDYGVTAVVCHLQEGVNGVTTYALADYTEEQGATNAILPQAPDFSREYCVELCNQVWGGLWE